MPDPMYSMEYQGLGGLGGRYAPNANRYAAALLGRQNYNNGTHAGGMASMAQSILQAMLLKGDMDAEAKNIADTNIANTEMVRGMTAQPWVNPDTGKPQGSAGGFEGGLAAMQNLGPDNAAAGKLSQALLMQKVERDQKLADRAAEFYNANAMQGRRAITGPNGQVIGVEQLPGFGQTMGGIKAQELTATTPAEAARAGAIAQAQVPAAISQAQQMVPINVQTQSLLNPVLADRAGATANAQLPSQQALSAFNANQDLANAGPKAGAIAAAQSPFEIAKVNAAAAAQAPSKAMEAAGKLRDDFNGQQVVKNYKESVPIFNSMQESLARDTPASDLNLVYGIAKLMDPASVVREGETKMAVQTGSPAEQFVGLFNYVAGGARLTPEMRAKLFEEAQSRVGQHIGAYNEVAGQFTDIAKRNNIDPRDVIIGLKAPEMRANETPKPSVPGAPSINPALQYDPTELLREIERRGGIGAVQQRAGSGR
jgi:hypothetical protein